MAHEAYHEAYIGLGSNLGDRRSNLDRAVAALRGDPGVENVELSEIHETLPVGGPAGQGPFLNAAARVATTLEPAALLELLLSVEVRLGRVRREKWGPRTIDLDLLLFDDCVIDSPEMKVPHPRMHERWFVLKPLAGLAGDLRHPVLDRTINELLMDVEK
jgi:2-amino-4-hydroxy-6-hydroxymethyldihydropteridine diphosphokinase